MNKLFLGLAIISIIAMQGCDNEDELQVDLKAQQKIIADSVNYTTVKWIDSSVNFGTINMGEKIQIKFRCLNTGIKPLIIINARPGCGCTLANYTKEPIAPGAEGLITAAFDSNKTHGGTVTKSIIVNTNTRNGQEHFLSFTGTVKGGEPEKSNDIIAVPHAVKPETKKS